MTTQASSSTQTKLLPKAPSKMDRWFPAAVAGLQSDQAGSDKKSTKDKPKGGEAQ